MITVFVVHHMTKGEDIVTYFSRELAEKHIEWWNTYFIGGVHRVVEEQTDILEGKVHIEGAQRKRKITNLEFHESGKFVTGTIQWKRQTYHVKSEGMKNLWVVCTKSA